MELIPSTVPPDTDIQLRATIVMLRAVNGQSARTRRPRSKGPRWTHTQPKPHFEAALVCVAMTHIGARREGKHRAAAPYQVRSTATRFAPRRRIMRRIRIDTFTRTVGDRGPRMAWVPATGRYRSRRRIIASWYGAARYVVDDQYTRNTFCRTPFL